MMQNREQWDKHSHLPKHIGIIHFKTGDTDGVSLEIDKWKNTFESLGHKVFLCSGEQGKAVLPSDVTLVGELQYHLPEVELLHRETFHGFTGHRSENDYRRDLETQSAQLKRSLGIWMDQCHLDTLVVENIWSVALHPAAAIGLDQAIAERKLTVIAHDHDFHWERIPGGTPSCQTASDTIDKYLPPRNPAYTHVVINTLARESLAKRTGIVATVVPNVFDFSSGPWTEDSYNQDFRQTIGLFPEDLFILQATRIVPRKGIELAIDYAQALQERRCDLIGQRLYNGRIFTKTSQVVLVLAGYDKDDANGEYLRRLQQKAIRQGVRMLCIGHRIAAERLLVDNCKTYSLWDTYVHADIVTYPSYWEGWGNQLLEAVKARLPVVLFEYPVYRSDIASMGFSMISLGDTLIGKDQDSLVTIDSQSIKRAVDLSLAVLFDRQAREDMVELNHTIAQRCFPLASLRVHLERFLK